MGRPALGLSKNSSRTISSSSPSSGSAASMPNASYNPWLVRRAIGAVLPSRPTSSFHTPYAPLMTHLSSFRRSLSSSSFGGANLTTFQKAKIEALEEMAVSDPYNAQPQADLYRELNARGLHHLVRARYDSKQFASDEAAYREYQQAVHMLSGPQAHAFASPYNHNNYSPFSQQPQHPYVPVTSSPFSNPNQPSYHHQPHHNYSHSNSSQNQGQTDAGTTTNPIVVKVTQEQTPPYLQFLRAAALVVGVGLLVMMFKRSGTGFGIPSMDVYKETNPSTDPKTTFDDVKGCDEAKAELEEIVQYLRNPEDFTRLGGKLPKGLLLEGPPGTGKTLLARAIAGEAGVPFFYCSGSEFEEMFVGVGARRVRELFAAAKKKAPCIVFIDEIDAIGGKRQSRDTMSATRMTLNQLLVELDGFENSTGVIVIGATNFPQMLDKALVRPGRFDRHVNVPLPDLRGRKQILDLYAKKIMLEKDVDLTQIARGTPGCSGAELYNLINSAAIRASTQGQKAVTMTDLEYAKDKILMGAERKSAVMSEENKKLTAYHEGGHAIMAISTKGAYPVHKATIIPRGQALGMVHQLPEDDVVSVDKEQLLARLDVAMGGRVAEEMIFGPEHITTGASSDLEQANRVARDMVMRYGMSERLGKLVIDDQTRLSNGTFQIADEEIKKLLEDSYERTRQVLKEREADLHRLATALLQYETLDRNDILDVCAGKELNRDPLANPTPSPSPSTSSSSSSAPKQGKKKEDKGKEKEKEKSSVKPTTGSKPVNPAPIPSA